MYSVMPEIFSGDRNIVFVPRLIWDQRVSVDGSSKLSRFNMAKSNISKHKLVREVSLEELRGDLLFSIRLTEHSMGSENIRELEDVLKAHLPANSFLSEWSWQAVVVGKVKGYKRFPNLPVTLTYTQQFETNIRLGKSDAVSSIRNRISQESDDISSGLSVEEITAFVDPRDESSGTVEVVFRDERASESDIDKIKELVEESVSNTMGGGNSPVQFGEYMWEADKGKPWP